MIWHDIQLFVLLSVKLVLQNITWKENAIQKVSNWGYCANVWMNGENWSQEMCENRWFSEVQHEYVNKAKNAWTSHQVRDTWQVWEVITDQCSGIWSL